MKSKLRHVGFLIHDWNKIRPFYQNLGFRLFYESLEFWIDKKIMVRKMRNKAGDVLEFISGAAWPEHIALTVDELPNHDNYAICKFGPDLQVKIMRDPEGNWIEFVKEL